MKPFKFLNNKSKLYEEVILNRIRLNGLSDKFLYDYPFRAHTKDYFYDDEYIVIKTITCVPAPPSPYVVWDKIHIAYNVLASHLDLPSGYEMIIDQPEFMKKINVEI
jgi:hypothetical protein